MSGLLAKFIGLFGASVKRYKIQYSSFDNIGSACMIGGSAYSVHLSSKIDEQRVMDTFVANVVRALKECDPAFESVVHGNGQRPVEPEEMMAGKTATYWVSFEVSAEKSGGARYVLFYTNTPAFFRLTLHNAIEAAQVELDAMAELPD
jgi:hypothetical protein